MNDNRSGIRRIFSGIGRGIDISGHIVAAAVRARPREAVGEGAAAEGAPREAWSRKSFSAQ